jgi:hypothetical protein
VLLGSILFSLLIKYNNKSSKKGAGKKNNIFKEVIVEDEAEDMRVSQMGAQN